MTEFILTGLLPAVSLTTFVFIYMYFRLKVMIKELDDKQYQAQPFKSAIELLVFCLVFAVSLVIVTGNGIGTGAMLACTLLAIIISYLCMNMLMVKFLKLGAVVIAIFVFAGYYWAVAAAANTI